MCLKSSSAKLQQCATMDWFLRRTTNSLLLRVRSSLTWWISPTCAHPRLESVFLDESHDRNQEFLCGLSSYCATEMHPDDLLTCLHTTQPHAWLSNYLTQLQPSPVYVYPRTLQRRTPKIKRISDHTGVSLRAQHFEVAVFGMQSERSKKQEMYSKPTHAQVCVLSGLQRDFIPLRLKLSFPTELVIGADTGASWALRLWPSVLNNVQLQTCGGRLAPKNLTTPRW